jgi:hypothetical protein
MLLHELTSYSIALTKQFQNKCATILLTETSKKNYENGHDMWNQAICEPSSQEEKHLPVIGWMAMT